MNCKYVLTETTYHNGKHTRTSYGIAIISTEDNITVLSSVEDISNDRDDLAKLLELCNAEGLEIEHLQSIVEDFLCVKR